MEDSPKTTQISEETQHIIGFFVTAVKETKGFPYFPTSVDAAMAKHYAEKLVKGEEFPSPEELITFYLQGELWTISLAKALSKYSINQFYLKNNGWRDRKEN